MLCLTGYAKANQKKKKKKTASTKILKKVSDGLQPNFKASLNYLATYIVLSPSHFKCHSRRCIHLIESYNDI